MTTGIAKDTLNLRSGPSSTTAIARVIPTGTQLTILGTSGDWLNVQTPDSAVGFVMATYVDVQGELTAQPVAQPTAVPASATVPAAAQPVAAPPTPAAPVTVVISNKMLTFSGDTLNVRSSPSVVDNPDNKVETLQRGAQLQPLEDDASLSTKIGSTKDQGMWVHVRTPSGTEGYVAAWLVQFATTTIRITQQVPAVGGSGSQSGTQQVTVEVTTSPTSQPTVTMTQGGTGVSAAPSSGAMIQPDVHNYINTIPNDYPLPQGYFDFWAQKDRLGLPDPFDISPTKLDVAHIGTMPVNGFGPNAFSAVNWQSYYKNVCGMHNGLDHIVPTGTPLVALSDGVIVGTQQTWPFMGNPAEQCLILWCFLPEFIKDLQGRRMLSNVLIAYAHMSNNTTVKRHDVVKAGQVIGISGHPVNEPDNAHLHLEIHMLSGDPTLPKASTRKLLGDFKRPQPFDNRTPFNPMLFFSERLAKYHLHQGKKEGFNSGPTYPGDDRLKRMGLTWPTLDFFTLASFQYGTNPIWNITSTPWPAGIYDLTSQVQRLANFTAFEPYPADFL